MLEIVAPDASIRAKYMEPITRAQATVEFQLDYKLTNWMNLVLPKECAQHAIKSIILKETKQKKNQPIKKVLEWEES